MIPRLFSPSDSEVQKRQLPHKQLKEWREKSPFCFGQENYDARGTTILARYLFKQVILGLFLSSLYQVGNEQERVL